MTWRFDGARRGRVLTLLVCAASLIGCAYELVNGGAVDQAKAEKIQSGIQEIRQLRFSKPVPVMVESRDQAEQDMIADLARDYTDDQLKVDGQAGILIGLYPPGTDLKASTIKLMKSQIAGFYDPHRKQMILVQGAADFGFWNKTAEFVMQRDVIGEMLLAHELTHALQDQNFGLETALDKIKEDDDRSLALKSIAEGDATLAGFAYVAGKMDGSVADMVESRLSDLPAAFAAETPGTPEGISAPLIFQYSAGVKFVAEAYRRGGWKAVDALYAAPPLSSKEIMKPSTYFDYPVAPVEVTLGGYEKVLGGWTKAEDNTLGELLMQIILKRGLGDHAPQVALAERWRGDKMIVLRQGTALTVIWYAVFTDDASAQQFAAMYITILDRLLGQRTLHRMDYRGRAVLTVIGGGARQFDQLAPAIWNSTVVRQLPARMPAAAAQLRAESPAVSSSVAVR